MAKKDLQKADTEEQPVVLGLVEEGDRAMTEVDDAVIAVTVAFVQDDRVVLEWRDPAGSLRRNWADVPVAEATEKALNEMDPYGDDLSVIAQSVSWSRADVVEELHRMGVWRLDDVTPDVLSNLYQGIARQAVSKALQRMEETRDSGRQEVIGNVR